MKIFKKLLHALLFPHIAILIILVPIAAAMLIYAFAFENAHPMVAYASYFLSAYTLTIVCFRTPAIIRWAKTVKQDNKYISRYLTDAHLRVKISLYSSLFLNVLYAVFQMGLGFYHASVWFYSLAVYYILLAVMRYFLLQHTRRGTPGEDRFRELLLYRFCGVLLAVMNVALAVIVTYIVWQNRGFEHHFITTIAMATYTFASLTMAIINVVKYRKYQSPVMSATKAISLAAACVSMLTLETAMLTAFGEGNDPVFRQIMTAATGAAVCVFVLVLAVYMIVRGTKMIQTIKRSSST